MYTSPDGTILSVPTTPTPTKYIGEATAYTSVYESSYTIIGGPNDGYGYIGSIKDLSEFDWVISQDADNPISVFYGHQCGNYNYSTKIGFISGANLKRDVTRHESGSIQSHYQEYVNAFNADGTNYLGSHIEALTAYPAGGLGSKYTSLLQSFFTPVQTAVKQEPCGSHAANVNASCISDGNVNYSPYVVCQ